MIKNNFIQSKNNTFASSAKGYPKGFKKRKIIPEGKKEVLEGMKKKKLVNMWVNINKHELIIMCPVCNNEQEMSKKCYRYNRKVKVVQCLYLTWKEAKGVKFRFY